MELVRYEAARSALVAAHNIDEVKDIRDKAEALRAYARQAGDVAMLNMASEIKVRAERRAGELLRDAADRGERATAGVNQHRSSHDATTSLSDLGITRSQSSRWQQVAVIPERKFETYIQDMKEQGRELTSAGVRKLAKQVAPVIRIEQAPKTLCHAGSLDELVATGMKFGTIYADPPWQYSNQGTRGATGDHYNGMTVDEICDLPVSQLVDDNAHLHLWTTNAFLFDAKRVLESWGFTYKSCYVWVKPQIGMGNYWRVSHEFMLLGVRGSCTFPDKTLKSWGEFPRGRHSAKPNQVRKLIERVSPGRRLELFGRSPADGWVVWGNQIEQDVFSESLEAIT